MKELGRPEIRKISAAKSGSTSLKTTVPREAVSLLELKYGDELEWRKMFDDRGTLGSKGEILAIVRKKKK